MHLRASRLFKAYKQRRNAADTLVRATDNPCSNDRLVPLTCIAEYTDPGNPLALVVHPDPEGPSGHQLEFRGPRGLVGRILVLGLDTRSDPGTAAEPLRKAIADFAASVAGRGRGPTAEGRR
ncbi:hypothetical protein PUR34_36540 [Streptomyces sp. JV185]|uniref:hypothetical protein n=1 Tax=Streptomyces sp. JV185 TaxID=858638 RepID=UPI002E770DA9|nr:hypothetical protein [Streptomyces sp. JV185]MEE1773530.1 hypothetical protein [Streptomyces sp. JV185]